MNPKSAIAKGKRYENSIVQQIRESGLDTNAGREIGSGSGLKKGDIRSSIPFLIEAKNEAGVPKWLLERIDQARNQCIKGFAEREKWCLVFRDPRSSENNSDDYAVIEFSQFLELIKKSAEPKTINPDKNVKWKIERLVQSAKEVIKELGA